MLRRMYGDIVPVPQERVLVADVERGKGFPLRLGARALEFIDVKGHAKHHYAIWDTQSRGWFSGDTFGVSYRALDQDGHAYIMPTTTPIDFDPEAWALSLDRLMAPEPAYMYLTHYGRVDKVSTLARELRQGLGEYVRIATEAANHADRHAFLKTQLMAFHLQQLHERDLRLPDERLRELISPDVEINAQGLGVWLDRQA